MTATAGLTVRARVPLRDFEVDVDERFDGITALVGPSGAGKSTLLRVVAGLQRVRDAEVRCGDRVWQAGGRAVAPEARGIGYVPQEDTLFEHLDAIGNVEFGMRDVPRRERPAAARRWLRRFGVEHLASARPRSVSGGERRRVALARALATHPRIVLLDEPLAALDPSTSATVAAELRAELDRLGVPAIVVGHSFLDAAALAPRFAVLEAGRIVQRGSAEELAAAPGSAYVADFAGACVLAGVAEPGEHGLTRLTLASGATILSTQAASGPARASVFPWEITLGRAAATDDEPTSALNALPGTVDTVLRLGARARVVVRVPEPLVAEVTVASCERAGIVPGASVVASWKATATGMVADG